MLGNDNDTLVSMGEKDAGGSLRDQAKSRAGNKDITKAVLASPLVIPWSVYNTVHTTEMMRD